MYEPKNLKALENGTGISWREWLAFLEPYKHLDHPAMAKIVHQKIAETGNAKSPGWWAQGVTVAYEQYIGRRQPGQHKNGYFNVTVSRTVDGDMDLALANWLKKTEGVSKFNKVEIKDKPSINKTPKWRYWRCELIDGTKVTTSFQNKPASNKSLIAVNHDKLPSANDMERWRTFWKDYLRYKL